MAWPIVQLASAAVSAGTNMITGWQNRKTAKVQSEIKIIETKTDAEIKKTADRGTQDIRWENTSLEQSGWKDEFWTIIISIPLVMCFIPGLVDYVVAGFAALEKTPKWYQALVATAFASAFGVKKFVSFMQVKKGE